MKDLNYSILIDQPPEVVFEKIQDKSIYPEWAKAWGEGMTYQGEWEVGKHIAFHDATQGGTKAIIEDMRAPEFIKMKHVAMVDSEANEIELSNDEMKKWMGTLEQYFFEAKGEGQTTLKVLVRTDEAFQEMMDGSWPKALEYFKELCERS